MTLGGGSRFVGHGFKEGNTLCSHPGESNGRYSHGGRVNGKTTPEYKAWENAKQRCNNPNNSRYFDWGGRGIEFRFESFSTFLKEVGLRPSPDHVIDRADNNGHYEPGNVRWVTRDLSNRNKRRNGGSAFRDSDTGRYAKVEL